MSKKEILDKHRSRLSIIATPNGGEIVEIDFIETVMDEYAKEVAIGFGNWLLENGWKRGHDTAKDILYWYKFDDNKNFFLKFTDEIFELYVMYLKSLPELNK